MHPVAAQLNCMLSLTPVSRTLSILSGMLFIISNLQSTTVCMDTCVLFPISSEDRHFMWNKPQQQLNLSLILLWNSVFTICCNKYKMTEMTSSLNVSHTSFLTHARSLWQAAMLGWNANQRLTQDAWFLHHLARNVKPHWAESTGKWGWIKWARIEADGPTKGGMTDSNKITYAYFKTQGNNIGINWLTAGGK